MAHDTAENGHGDERRTQTSGNRSASRTRTLRIRLALAVGVGATIALATGGLVLGRAALAVRGLERSQYAAVATETRVRLNRLVDRDRARLMEAAFSDQIYQLAATQPAAADSFIRPAFAERFPLRFGDQFVAVYGMAGAARYRWSADPALERIVATTGLFRMLDNREPTVGLVRSGDRLVWVGGAPILPANFADPTQPIRGYLVVAQVFNPAWVAPSAADRGGRFELRAMAPPSQPFQTRVDGGAGRETIDVAFALSDIFAQQSTLATLTASRAEFLAVEARLRLILMVAALTALALAVLAYRSAVRWLVLPAENLAAALGPVHKGQVPGLVAPVSGAAEWTTVTAAVNRLISHGRGTQDRFERLTGVASEGLWERDLASGDWTVNAAFRSLVGYREQQFATPLLALADNLHPDDGSPLLAWLASPTRSGDPVVFDVRVRRERGSWARCRFAGRAITDAAGGTSRLIGTVSDLCGPDAATTAGLEAERRRLDAERVAGRLLVSLATGVVPTPADRRHLGHAGAVLAGTIAPAVEPFDLYALLQETANGRPAAELTIVPGVADRVSGDRALVRAALDGLLDTAATGARIRILADSTDRQHPHVVRLAVEHHGLPEIERTRLVNAFSDPPAGPDAPPCAALAATHLARALNGRAGADPGDPVRCWIAVPLPAAALIAPPPAEAPPEVWDSSETFEIEQRRSAPFGALDPADHAAPVELAADETVQVRLDEPATPKPAISDRFAERLGWRDPVCLGVARTVATNGPGRLGDLEAALRDHQYRNATEAALDLNRMAAALEADELERTTRYLVDAIENQYGDGTDVELAGVQRAWRRVVDSLGAAGHQPPTERTGVAGHDTPAIEPATLERLTASLNDGAGLAGQLIGMFLAEAPARVDAIEQAAGAANWQALGTAARELHGMCGLIGAGRLGACCMAAAEASGPAAWAAALAVRGEWTRVHRVLDGLMGARTGA